MAQERLFDPADVNFRKASPVQGLVASAQNYTGGTYDPSGLENTQVKGADGYSMYRTHARGLSDPPSPETLKSYEAMRGHISKQFQHLTTPVEQGGAGINVEVTDHDPYGSFEDMHADVTQNSRLRVMSTETTGEHTFFSNEENDQFRAVHDAYGHLATGRGHDRHGEEAAYLSHRQMLPKEAHAALASETRGQNSFLNWGGGDFPENATVNTPDWMTKPTVQVPPAPTRSERTKQEKLF